VSERIEELKGNLKEGAGKVTGDRELEAEGRGEKTIAQTERKIKGTAEETKGKLEQGIGKLTGDESTRAQGTVDRIEGETERR
jgi:uncharacterized protein YjbJ (UPF0337 family)